MTMVRKKLIEVSIPLETINIEAKRRKQKAPKGYPTAIHKYWAQRPIAACRAVLFSQVVDDPSAWPDRFPTEEAQDAERRRLHKVMERMVPWEASCDETILNEARWEIARSVAWGLAEEPPPKNATKAILDYLQTKAPPVYDPFSGGGSIPLEAQRLGLRAYGSDLNPVAVLIGKALVEIPPKFSGLPPVNPKARLEAAHGELRDWKGAQGLAEDVRHYGQWMRDEAEKKIAELYPKVRLADGSDATVTAWLWVRTVRSPDPAANGAPVPLVSSFLLSTKEGKKVWVEPIIEAGSPDGWHFEVRSGVLSKAEEARLRQGTKSEGRGSSFSCLLTGAAISGDYIKVEGMAGRMGARLMAIVAEVRRGRVYVSPEPLHEIFATSLLNDERVADAIGGALNQPVPERLTGGTCFAYGLTTFSRLFTARQLIALTTFSNLVEEVRKKSAADAEAAGWVGNGKFLYEGGDGAQAYADAIATYIGMAIDRMATYGSTLCKWLTKDNALAPSIPQHAIIMSYDFAEGNPFGKSSAEATRCVSAVASSLEFTPCSGQGRITETSAQNVKLNEPVILATDPPYYDNIAYADISDFFYVWMARSLKQIWPEHFRRLSTPKDAELVATAYRHGGNDNAERFFIEGMKTALRNLVSQAVQDVPITIFYAFRQTEIGPDGVSSRGWSSFLQALVDCGIAIDGTWPLRTELTSALKTDVNSLASSIVLVCRKQPADAAIISRAEFIRALKSELPDAIDDIRKAGVGPVDMQQSVIGPSMGVFTRYGKVLENDDSAMSVKTALSLINRVWEEIENELDTNFDPETQVALAWFATYGFETRGSGELIGLANAKNISLSALFHSGVFSDLHGKTALKPRNDLLSDWSPATDTALTVWACVQHTARVLNAPDGGGEAAARLVAQMGPQKAADARALAYRLYEICSQKGLAGEALVYNELAQEWARLEDIAINMASPALTTTGAQGAFTFNEGAA